MSLVVSFSGAFNFHDILQIATPAAVAEIESKQATIDPDSGFNIQFTSGTTGLPKAALISHFSFLNNGHLIGKRNEFADKAHRICFQTPFFHAYGLVIGVMAALCHGVTMVLPAAGFDTGKSLEAIEREKCTVIYGTPTMYVDLLAKQKDLGVTVTSPEIAVTGGAPCTPELFRSIKQNLNAKKVKTVFGMTETTAVIFQSMYDETMEQMANTVGHIQEHVEAKVVDEQGATVPFGERGELWIRCYSTMLEYWDDSEKTRETIGNDKWLKTGDQFVMQEDGYGRIVGRLKEMIIRGGENIFPKEIEDFISTHSNVAEVHVVGVPDERMGEEMCAFVKLRPKTEFSLEDLRQFSKGNIAHFKVPKYMEVVEDFPKTQSGKIQKFKLLEKWLEGDKRK